MSEEGVNGFDWRDCIVTVAAIGFAGYLAKLGWTGTAVFVVLVALGWC